MILLSYKYFIFRIVFELQQKIGKIKKKQQKIKAKALIKTQMFTFFTYKKIYKLKVFFAKLKEKINQTKSSIYIKSLYKLFTFSFLTNHKYKKMLNN